MNTTDDAIQNNLRKVFVSACKSRDRHDKIIVAAIKEAKRVSSDINQYAYHFCRFVARKLKKNEAVIIGHAVLKALPAVTFTDLQKNWFEDVSAYRLETQTVRNKTSGQPILLVVSRHAFRVAEITQDIWLAMNPEASQEDKDKNKYVVSCTMISENLAMLNKTYSAQDLIDVLHLVGQEGAFYMRAGFLYVANIEPKPFIEKIESLGFIVAAVLDETPSNEVNNETDFIKRLQGLLVAKTPESFQRGNTHLDFLIELNRLIPLPETDLTRKINLG